MANAKAELWLARGNTRPDYWSLDGANLRLSTDREEEIPAYGWSAFIPWNLLEYTDYPINTKYSCCDALLVKGDRHRSSTHIPCTTDLRHAMLPTNTSTF